MANRFVAPVFTALDSIGVSISGAKLNFYQAGTTTRLDTFSDNALTSAHANPVVADSAGRFPDIFLQAQNYKVVFTDAVDVTIWTADPVAGTVVTTGDEFIPTEQSPQDMTTMLGTGSIFNVVTKALTVVAAQTSALVVAPTTNPRNDIVFVDRLTGVDGTTTGVEAPSPTDPTIPDDKLPVERIRTTVGMTEITSADIDDIRELNLLGSGDLVRFNTGVADGNIPKMDATGYPAADGSQITGVVTIIPETIVDATNGGADDLTLIDFTGIPATAKRITIMFDRISLTGTDQILVQIGDAGGIENTGYSGAGTKIAVATATSITSTIGFIIRMAAAADIASGMMVLTLIDAATFRWTSSHALGESVAPGSKFGGGSKALSDTLTQVRITRTGTNTFDGGNLNLLVE